MEEEHPKNEAEEAEDQYLEETLVGENTASESSKDGDSEASSWTANHSRLVIGAVVLIVVLVVVGLLLPPISLGERLAGLGGEDTPTAESESVAVESTEPAETMTEGNAFALTVNGSDKGIKTSSLSQEEFLNKEAGDEWVDAADTIPAQLTLSSDVYTVEYKDEAPQGSAAINILDSAQPYQTLDLFGWTGEEWRFIPSTVAADGSQLTSASGLLPQAYALMQTQPLEEKEIGAEVLPTQELPVAVLPVVTEVLAGTLTLSPDGSIVGEVVSVPNGAYRQLLRVTNTGALVDTISLSAMLSDPNAQAKNIQAIIDRVEAGNFSGVNLDYQGVDPMQADAFSTFVDDLARALDERGLSLAVTLETPVDNGGEWDTGGQNWQSLGQSADVVYLQMPIDPTVYGDNDLAEQLVAWSTRQVDRSKLMMLNSVNAVDGVGDTHREVQNSEALSDFGEITFVSGSSEVESGETVEVALSGTAGALEWDPASMTYKYSYDQAGQPHNVWLGSEALLSHRSRFADRYNLRGVAARGLGDVGEGTGYAAAIESFIGLADPPQPSSAAIVWAVEDEDGGVVASSTGEDLTYEWQTPEEPGRYVIQARFAQGDSVADLDAQDVMVLAPIEPDPTPEPEEEDAAEEEEEDSTPAPAVAAAQSGPVNPGDADAAANTAANVRNGPGLGYGIIGGVQPGEKVSLLGRNDAGSWLQVKLLGGEEGWIFGNLLTVNSSFDVNGLSVVAVDPPAGVVASDDGGTSDSGGGAPAPAPVIAPAGGGSFELGGQAFGAPYGTMSYAGMNWVKRQHKWGPGNTGQEVAGMISEAHNAGFKILLSMPGSPYPSSINFAEYVGFLGRVASLPDPPDAIEIWNEENIDAEWPAGQIDPASYVNNMLAPGYNAIKSANSSIMVISGAPAPTGFDNGTNAWSDQRYMAGVAAAGGANYMDCIGVHHNAGVTSPNATSGHPGGSHYSWYFWPTLNMYYNSFGGSRPVCFTELGFVSGEGYGGVPSRFSWASNVTVANQAQWLGEAASLSANSGKVRLLIVWNVDSTTWGEDPQAGYAIIRPGGSCPACDVLGQVMGR